MIKDLMSFMVRPVIGIISLAIMGYIDISTISQLISYVFSSRYTYKNLYEDLYTLPNERSAEHEGSTILL